MKRRLVWLSVALLVASTAAARDLEDILKEKKVIDAVEANEAKAAKERAQAATDKAVLGIPSLPDWVKMVTFFGDVRVRNEAFFRKGDVDRNRDRFRLRFGAKVKATDEAEVGFKLASGNASDPISNNQTFTDEFTFKSINIANAYLKLMPAKSIGLDRPWVTLMGGKFDQPMYVPPSPNMLVYDKDLTPEGFFESLKAVEEKDGFLRGLALNLGQWIIEENSKTGEAAIYAFQGVGNMALGDLLWNIGVADYKYVDPSSIAVARNKNTALAITNNVTLSDGEVLGGRLIDPTTAGPTKNGIAAPTVDPKTGATVPGKPITITKFNSKFNDVDVATDLLIPTGLPAWPVRLFGDYVKNTDATGSDDQGYQGGISIGALKDPGDIIITYAYQRLETDAVVSAFSDSDFGHDGGTNTKAHILQAGLVLNKYVTLLSTAWIDKPINNVSGRSTETDHRWQVDLLGKF
jgi:hypothetical protein